MTPRGRERVGAEAEGNKTEAPRKRQRVSRACDQCRASREKCNGQNPCSTCASHDRECTWITPKRTRGLPSGYIRTLEASLGWLFGQSATLEPALHQALSVRKSTVSSEQSLQSWKNSTVRKKIESLVSRADDQSIAQESSDEEQPPSVVIELATTPASSAIAPATITKASLPTNPGRLLDIYFSYTHNWFPILDKALIQKAVWSYNGTARPDDAQHPELWALFALAACQDESLRSTPTPSEMYTFAKSLITLDVKFGPEHVKALLLLTLINIGRQELDVAWILIGLACNLRFDLSDDWRSRYTLMGCALLDAVVATQLNRPRHVLEQISLPNEVDVQDEWENWTACEGFEPQTISNRFPARSISSFRSLFLLHVHGTLPLDVTLTGTPSAQLLQIAMASVEDQQDLLSLLEAYVGTFGLCSMPPLFSFYMTQANALGHFAMDRQHRWVALHNAVQTLYKPGEEVSYLSPLEPVALQPRSASMHAAVQQQQQQQQQQTHSYLQDDLGLPPNFSLDPNVDYDAIMNEISLVDSRDMNAQFMINLGFGPESNLDEMFGYGYGGHAAGMS